MMFPMLLAQAIEKKERGDLLELGIELEGHPENVSASLFGGCTLSLCEPGEPPRLVQHPLHAQLGFAVAWPNQPMNTERARAVLPG